MITSENIRTILDAARIEEVVGEFINLKKRGVNLIGLCPFHNEKTPSFNVSIARGIFKCFGCGKGGNTVNFLMEYEHYTYPEALKFLAKKYNIEIIEEHPSLKEQQYIDEKEDLLNITTFAQKHFVQNLHNTNEGKQSAIPYLIERGFKIETIKKFGLGYSLDKWDDFTLYASKNGYKKEYLLKTSLSKQKDQQYYDTFRGRIIFPIHNISGRVIGFGARVLSNEKNQPKYLNTAESEIYHKSNVLYGLFFAKNAVVREKNCYLVEGYTDVISLHQVGIENVVASSGTSLTQGQIKLIKRYTNNITLLFDNDLAGIKAAFRSIDLIIEAGMNIQLVLLPAGEDPDSFIKKHKPEEVKQFIVKNTVNFIFFKTNFLLRETEGDIIRKAELIKEIAQSISLIPDIITRTIYIQQCSQIINIEENVIITEVNKIIADKNKKSNQKTSELPLIISKKNTPQLHKNQHEYEIIRLLLHFAGKTLNFNTTDEYGKTKIISTRLIDFIVDYFSKNQIEFKSNTCQEIYNIIAQYDDLKTISIIEEVLNHSNQEVKTLSVGLLSEVFEKTNSSEIETEEIKVEQNLFETLFSYKLKISEELIKENNTKLKQANNEKELIGLIKKEKNLQSEQSKLIKEFGFFLNCKFQKNTHT